METPQIYILISIIALLIIAVVIFFVRKDKKQKPLSTLASISFMFVIFGIIFGESRIISYSLIGIGVLLAVIDIIIKSRKNENKNSKK